MKSALTIAGSDSIGGAGIQADLKAFASLGVHGCSAITCITAQNTTGISRIDPVPPDMVRKQLEAVLSDISPDAVKTGAIFTAENVEVIADLFPERKIPIIVDPVLVATTGARLSKDDFVPMLRKRLLPICALITPNISEAKALTGIEVASVEQAAKVAEQLHSMGAAGVLVKGIISGDTVSDYLSMAGGEASVLSSVRWPGEFHGTGCVLSSLIAAQVALGDDICTAVVKARGMAHEAIGKGKRIGKGIGIINPVDGVLSQAERFHIIEILENSRHAIEERLPVALVPEVGSNLGFCIESPLDERDVAGFTGRIIREGKRARVIGCAKFGASKHVARIVIAANRQDGRIRCAMNVKYNQASLKACEKTGMSMSSFSRKNEPEGVSSMSWGVDVAIKDFGSVPDIIWDDGGHGKEPMVRVLGSGPVDVLGKVFRIADNL